MFENIMDTKPIFNKNVDKGLDEYKKQELRMR